MATAVVSSKRTLSVGSCSVLFYVYQIIMHVNSRTNSTVNIVPALNRPISTRKCGNCYALQNWGRLRRPTRHSGL